MFYNFYNKIIKLKLLSNNQNIMNNFKNFVKIN